MIINHIHKTELQLTGNDLVKAEPISSETNSYTIRRYVDSVAVIIKF